MTKYINLSCPRCQTAQRLRREYLGRRLTCVHCLHSFRPTVAFSCPACQRTLTLGIEQLGRWVRCEHCNCYSKATIRKLCPGCQKPLRMRSKYLGHAVTCKGCGRASCVRLEHSQILLSPVPAVAAAQRHSDVELAGISHAVSQGLGCEPLSDVELANKIERSYRGLTSR